MYKSEKVRKKHQQRYQKACVKNLFIDAAAQIRAVYKDHKILDFEKVYYFVFKFLDSQYSYITNTNNWAVVKRNIDVHVGT